ncbi:MAG: spore coat associated protein CotJA [Roseburia sp.]
MRNYNMSGGMERRYGCGYGREQSGMQKNPCDRGMEHKMQGEYVVGMAYVPWQYFSTVYEIDRALEVGTIFPELDKSFRPQGRGMVRR